MKKGKYRRWSEAEISRLRELAPIMPQAELALMFGRSMSSIASALADFKIPGRGRFHKAKMSPEARELEITYRGRTPVEPPKRVDRKLYLMARIATLRRFNAAIPPELASCVLGVSEKHEMEVA